MKEKKHDGGITEALFFQNDKRILTASRDGFAKVYKIYKYISFTVIHLFLPNISFLTKATYIHALKCFKTVIYGSFNFIIGLGQQEWKYYIFLRA